MNQEQFEQIIDTAIAKEEEAVTFYKMLKTKIQFKQKEDFLQDLVDIERGHVKVLQNIKKNKHKVVDIKPVENLGIADYLVPSEVDDGLDYKSLLELAMKKEQKAQKFYEDMVKLFSDEEVKNVFLKLANEEAKHKYYFEKIYDDEILTEN